jgi:hypothetical protein
MAIAADARDRVEPRPWGSTGAAFVSVLLFSALVYSGQVGFLIGILGLVCPFPLVIQRLRGALPAILTLLAALLLIGALFKDSESAAGYVFGYAVFFAAPAWLIGEAMVRGHGLRRGCVWAFLLVAVEFGIILLLQGPGFGEELRRQVVASYSAPDASAGMPSFLRVEGADSFADQIKSMADTLVIVYPALFLVFGGAVVVLNGAAVRFYLARRDPAWLDGGEFEGLRWPFGLAVAFVVAGLGVLVPAARTASYNVLLVIAFLLTLQGMAVVLYYAHRLAGPLLLRAALVISVILWAPQLLGLLGLFDLWFDFRRFADVPPPEGTK